MLYGLITEYETCKMYLYQIFYDFHTQRNLLYSFWNEESISNVNQSLARLREELIIFQLSHLE